MRKNILLLFLLIFAVSVQAQYYDITSHTIEIQVDDKGFSTIQERFFIGFPREIYEERFKLESAANGISLSAWEAFDSRIHTYIGDEKDISNVELAFVEDDGKYLEIKYGLKPPLMHVTRDTSRRTDYRLKENFLREFFVGTLLIIPDNTSIKFFLPQPAEIQGEVKPDASVEGNIVTFQGYKSSNIIELNYSIWKQIASFDLQAVIGDFLRSELMIFLGLIIFVLIIIGYANRKKLTGKIEEYIVTNSQTGTGEEELAE